MNFHDRCNPHLMRITYLVLMVLGFQIGYAQPLERRLCILDMQAFNNETNDARLFSLEQIADVAGIPTYITANITEAIAFPMIYLSSELKSSTFNGDEVEELVNYVTAGGVLIAPRVQDEDFYELFGITNVISSKNRYDVEWLVNEDPALFHWINENEEKTISLGRESQGDIYTTLGYEVAEQATVLGIYEDQMPAYIRAQSGTGTAYAFGFSAKDVIFRSQINRDYEAQRISNNGFEPTQDVFFFLLRNIYNQHVPFALWKHTSPYNSTSSLLITHDIDSRSGMDSLIYFTEDEQARGISATYNLTVRYFSDALMSDFYDYGKDKAIPTILNAGHKLGAHSVGHFFDFADDDIFPIGAAGNTVENYLPYNDGDLTTGGTVYGECEVSLNTLEEDSGEKISIFRTGHLAYNNNLINVLSELGYEFSTNYSAADVLTNFPYFTKTGRSFSGERTAIIEMPVTLSDVFHSDPISAENMSEKVDIWLEVLDKNNANGASTCLLIHPNRVYKANGQASFLDQLPAGVVVKEMGEYGNYWRMRSEVEFESSLEANVLTVKLNTASYSGDEQLSFIVADGQALDEIIVVDEAGNTIDLKQSDWENQNTILYNAAPIVSGLNEIYPPTEKFKIYPNPTANGLVKIEFTEAPINSGVLKIFDISGKLHYTKPLQINANDRSVDLNLQRLDAGIYFIDWYTADGRHSTKFIKQ